MTVNRRMGAESSKTRSDLIKAAEQIIAREGYGALTARRLGEKVGLKRQIVHYYFRTIEDVIVAVIRLRGEKARERLTRALNSDEPLRAIWEMRENPLATSAIFELSTLALRRKAVQAEVRRYMVEMRQIQAQAIARYLEQRGLKPNIPPVVSAMIISGMTGVIALESAVGVTEGHAELEALIESWLEAFRERGEAATPGLRSASG